MPTSSSSSKHSRLGGVLRNKRHLVSSSTFWAPNEHLEHQSDQAVASTGSSLAQTRAAHQSKSSTFQATNKSAATKPPTKKIQRAAVLASGARTDQGGPTEQADRKRHQSAMASGEQHFSLRSDQAGTLTSLAGQLVLTGAKQPGSLGSQIIIEQPANNANNRTATARNQLGAHTNKAYLASSGSSTGLDFAPGKANQIQHAVSQVSVSATGSQQPLTECASSTTRLHQMSNKGKSHTNVTATTQPSTTFTVKRHVNLKYIKTIIILLLAIDLVITVFVHQFSTNDQFTLLWFASLKLRFSLVNLILSSIWFIILIGAILFDVHFILAISCLVHIISFFLLLGFSVVHFSRRIDYNTVHLFSLLTLLFSIIVLHVYLLVLAALTLYLMRAVRNRRQAK